MPARLACVKPAASVRSEPGSNSQVGLETLSRLITTFDEVPPYLSPAIHIADDDGVTFSKRVPPKSFVRSRKLKTEVSKYSRSARTPPSTFLFLHLHLSNSPGSENPNFQPGRPHSTANDNRWLSAVDSLISMR